MSAVEIDPGQPGETPPRRDSTAQAVMVAVAVVVVVAALLAVVTGRLSSRTAQNKRNNAAISASYLASPNAIAAEAAASRETRATLTYNYKTLSADYAAAEAGLTPRFRANYLTTTASSVTPEATKTQAVSAAAVTAGGVSVATATTATVLLFVDQTVTNNLLAHPRLDRSRIKVSMVKLNGRWLVDNLSPI
jgi:Mce-associated membrane protein